MKADSHGPNGRQQLFNKASAEKMLAGRNGRTLLRDAETAGWIRPVVSKPGRRWARATYYAYEDLERVLERLRSGQYPLPETKPDQT